MKITHMIKRLIILIICCLIISGCSGKDKVDIQKYNKISYGMTLNDVTNIIGHQGKEMSSTIIPGTPDIPGIEGIPGIMPGIPGVKGMPPTAIVMMSWQNRDGSNIILTFEMKGSNDVLRVTQKAQAGL